MGRSHLLRLAAVASAMLMVSAQASAPPSATSSARPGKGAAEDCAALVQYPPVPDGLDLTTLSADELEKYGLPPRPTDQESEAYSDWMDTMKHATHFVAPTPVCPGTDDGGTFGITDNYSGNWSGYYIKAGDAGGHLINEVHGRFDVPKVSGNDYNYCDADHPLPPGVAPWVGIGGVVDADKVDPGNPLDPRKNLIQTGIVSCATGTPTYRMWTEDLPQKPRYEGVAISPGDEVDVYVYWLGNDTCRYYQENYTTGAYTPHTHDDCTHRGSHTADFVTERAGDHYLPTFAHFHQGENWLIDSNLDDYFLTPITDKYKITMTSDCTSGGTLLARPGSIGPSNGFYQYHHNDSPTNQPPCP